MYDKMKIRNKSYRNLIAFNDILSIIPDDCRVFHLTERKCTKSVCIGSDFVYISYLLRPPAILKLYASETQSIRFHLPFIYLFFSYFSQL